jgi:hypothetical protein
LDPGCRQALYEPGSHIGYCPLISVLGEGGFGMVYLAEQEHPIKRLVVLKVIERGFIFIGTLLWVYYRINPASLPANAALVERLMAQWHRGWQGALPVATH